MTNASHAKLRDQPLLSSFCNTTDSEGYGARHPRQTAITDALIDDLVIGCSLPLSIVENKHFRHFMSVLDHRYTPPARSTIASKLEKKVTVVKKNIKQELRDACTVDATVDIWSDRKMRGYMATTVHYVKKGEVTLRTGLLGMERFTGSHTGERIAAAFESVVDTYDIRHEIDHIVADNAANMRKAFTVNFPATAADQMGEHDIEETVDVDNPES